MGDFDFETVFHNPTVYKTIHHEVKRYFRSPEDREDATQEAWFRIWFDRGQTCTKTSVTSALRSLYRAEYNHRKIRDIRNMVQYR